MGFLDWLKSLRDSASAEETYKRALADATTPGEADAVTAQLSAQEKIDFRADWRVAMRKVTLTGKTAITGDLAASLFSTALEEWQAYTQTLSAATPETAKVKLAEITGKVTTLAAAVYSAEILSGKAGLVPAETTAGISHRTLTWLGFGAVLAAVAHDPVKISILRPYQDALEMTFRNRRPGDIPLFQAYRTRELTATKAEDLSMLDDALMNRIELENQTYYDREIAKWGYSESFAGALARSATRTLGFSQLVTLARAGIYDKGLAIYSLWGEGLDRVVMPAALTAIETLRDREMYAGFRSMIEPSYVEGDITEADLIAYWKLSGVPDTVRDWVLPRLRKKREAYALKLETGAAVRERDLTVSQIQQAYQNLLQDRAHAQNMILALGYSLDETKVLLDLAELRRKLPAAATLKMLPLSDYEKAYKAKLISQGAVLARMAGEYTAEDIALEKKLLDAGIA